MAPVTFLVSLSRTISPGDSGLQNRTTTNRLAFCYVADWKGHWHDKCESGVVGGVKAFFNLSRFKPVSCCSWHTAHPPTVQKPQPLCNDNLCFPFIFLVSRILVFHPCTVDREGAEDPRNMENPDNL
ncbi:Hypothetical protein NTJ_01254 [Nesidiocoris tenuis]|uniref:Uncharacterized protein n=1 Tax=Nesidiocoris tenuis TaxID=355587 RepID=A0ABN7A913_9HEMI|nr:Hypothetical protein NTJ_01254 [Nesidiocoris tenuis]